MVIGADHFGHIPASKETMPWYGSHAILIISLAMKYNETKGLRGFTVHTVDSRRHIHSTWKTTKYTEGCGSENKHICVLTKHLLSRESYE